ncbi:hypothetical protein FJY71_01995 [candidate division WOR-3 bacterium]|nr:hypothetical protein [candidate division WOR-3 bacterium]
MRNWTMSVLLSAALAAAQPVDINSILATGGYLAEVDTILLRYRSAGPDTVLTPGFGGDTGLVDTARLGRHDVPDAGTVKFRIGGRRMADFDIDTLQFNVWYELFTDRPLQATMITFYRPAAVGADAGAPEPARVTAYPNPFSLATTLGLQSCRWQTDVRVFDVFGREVAVLRVPLAGRSVTWQPGPGLGPGVYFAGLRAREHDGRAAVLRLLKAK